MVTEAIILAGGFGTRLQSVVNDLPKPMAQVNGQPFLNYQLLYLKHFGIQRVILSVGHLHEKITDHYKNEFEGLEIDYTIEKEPLGTGGGIRMALEKCKGDQVLILNGDSFFDIDLNFFIGQHVAVNADCSIALREVENAARYGTVELEEDSSLKGNAPMSRIRSFKEKSGEEKEGLINAGIYILNKKTYLNNTMPQSKFSIEKDFFEKQLSHLNIFGSRHEGYFIDIGIPEDYAKAQNDFKGFTYK
jgi:D-glycero-alpha-D-manno-heptose 1-phosphate guanylyltransferase